MCNSTESLVTGKEPQTNMFLPRIYNPKFIIDVNLALKT